MKTALETANFLTDGFVDNTEELLKEPLSKSISDLDEARKAGEDFSQEMVVMAEAFDIIMDTARRAAAHVRVMRAEFLK